MVRKIFEIVLLLAVLLLGIVVFMGIMDEKNVLALILIGFACLITVENIIMLIVDNLGIKLIVHDLVILLVLCYLGVEYMNIILYFMIFLLLLVFAVNWGIYVLIRGVVFRTVSYCALVACTIKIVNNGVFDFFHIGILIMSCLPLACEVISYSGEIDCLWSIIKGSYPINVNSELFWCICCSIILIASIVLKIMHIDETSLFFSLMAVVSVVGWVISSTQWTACAME